MASLDQLARVKVYVPRPAAKSTKLKGAPKPPKRIGKYHNLVFSPDGKRVVGMMVQRPDIAAMIKSDDVFAALDSLSFFEEGILISGDAATDKAAIERLGLDFDRCIIWGGMDVATRSGKALGHVTDITFDFTTGDVETIYVTDGAVAASLVGSVPIPADMVLGYSKGRMIVKDDAEDLSLTGGAAALAGEGFAKAKEAGKAAAHEAGQAASVAVDKGSFALGKAIGHARNMVRDVVTEDPEVAELPAEDVRVEKTATVLEEGGDSQDKPVTYVPSGKTGSDSESEKNGEEKTLQDSVDNAARVVGRQLGKTKGMFSSFLREFEENSK